MTIVATAPVPAASRLDEAATIRLQPELTHPAWCAQDRCLMDDGAIFHRAEVAEVQANAEDGAVGGTVNVYLEQLTAQDAFPTQIRVNDAFELTPQQARQLAAELLNAADLADGGR